jgi:Tol biopolymer transport system component/predicted Ser/Thr protein kinase
MIGGSLSHYEILEKLGEGGMGVVYKARDTHLERFVAIKVLPPERVADPERKRRFVQEAKAASALNHPNIITIYDISSDQGVDFIAMEYVPGKTLDELIPRRGMRLNDAFKCAIQIADALARAHAVGIVHRDLKPGNVMVDEHGLVKVLDFGLAKLAEPVGGEEAPTQTEEGAIVGTVAYMSPEQAQGKPVDARSDIFSFGSLLYEMVTGRRAFHGDTKISTLAAIINQEPASLAAETPRDLEKIITRCLRKDPARRLQTMADLKVALEELKEESDSGKLAAELPSRPRRHRWAAAGIAALLLTVAAALWFHFRKPVEEQEPRVTVFTSYAGLQGMPSFSPEGNQVAFTWQGEKLDNHDIYVKVIGTESALRLTTHPAVDSFPAWAPDGRSIAFLRQTSEHTAAIYRVAPLGGAERKIADVVVSGLPLWGGGLCWTRDGKWILSSDADSPGKRSYIVLVSSETGEKRKLTSGEGLGEFHPALSPDNRTLAFVRGLAVGQSLLFLLSLDTELRPTAAARQLRPAGSWNSAPVWTPDGKSLLFTGTSLDSFRSRLWRISASGDSPPAPVPQAGEGSLWSAVSPQGNRLVFSRLFADSNIWRIDVSGPGGRAGTPRQVVASTRMDQWPAFSPDGGRIAFESSRSGGYGVWLAKADGSNPQPLHVDPNYVSEDPAWSPDGRTIAFDARKDKQFQIYLISPEGGAPRRLTNHPSDNWVPLWSRDGKWVYFASNRTGRPEVWRMSAAGGETVQLTRNGGFTTQESPDGRTLFFDRERLLNSPTSLWKMPVEGGEETKVLDSVGAHSWALVDQGLWFINWTNPGDAALQFLEFATGKVTRVAPISKPPAPGLAVSPDGRTILYAQYDQRGSELTLVENFR